MPSCSNTTPLWTWSSLLVETFLQRSSRSFYGTWKKAKTDQQWTFNRFSAWIYLLFKLFSIFCVVMFEARHVHLLLYNWFTCSKPFANETIIKSFLTNLLVVWWMMKRRRGSDVFTWRFILSLLLDPQTPSRRTREDPCYILFVVFPVRNKETYLAHEHIFWVRMIVFYDNECLQSFPCVRLRSSFSHSEDLNLEFKAVGFDSWRA